LVYRQFEHLGQFPRTPLLDQELFGHNPSVLSEEEVHQTISHLSETPEGKRKLNELIPTLGLSKLEEQVLRMRFGIPRDTDPTTDERVREIQRRVEQKLKALELTEDDEEQAKAGECYECGASVRWHVESDAEMPALLCTSCSPTDAVVALEDVVATREKRKKTTTAERHARYKLVRERFKETCKLKGVTQKAVAERCGAKPPALNRLGKRVWLLDLAAAALSVRADWLETGSGPRDLSYGPLDAAKPGIAATIAKALVAQYAEDEERYAEALEIYAKVFETTSRVPFLPSQNDWLEVTAGLASVHEAEREKPEKDKGKPAPKAASLEA
jgi:transcriptional regulator with XRE-family HTH domain